MGLREEILGAVDTAAQPVEVPEWGKTLYVRAMSARARDAWEADNAERRKSGELKLMENFRARLVAMAVVDAEGKPVFSLEDAEALGEKSGAAVGRLFAKACDLNGLTSAEIEAHEKK